MPRSQIFPVFPDYYYYLFLYVAHLLCVLPFADEKERFDPTHFQESIVQGLNQTGTDLEAVAKFLDASGAKLDYRRYAETLFDILVAGGMLGKSPRTYGELRLESERS